MKKVIFSVLMVLLTIFNVFAQEKKEKASDWTAFFQSIEIDTDKETKFKLTGYIKVVSPDFTGNAGLWARVDTKDGERGFFDNMRNRAITKAEWTEAVIEGILDENSKTLNFGGIVKMNADFYFDNIQLFIENNKGEYEKVSIGNPSFEKKLVDEQMEDWLEGVSLFRQMSISSFMNISSSDAYHGKQSLKISSNGIESSRIRFITEREDYTPHIGALVSMLENMKYRVESQVKRLDQHQTDYLIDEQANRIGALIMHLVSAEKFYQVFTFEDGRRFNEEEKKEWQIAFDLGDTAREELQGKDIKYYLDLYTKVRQKTLEELKKRDDEWLFERVPGSDRNNYYSWYHVMEHQSSHLGQILMMKKRIPKKKENKTSKLKKREIKS